MHLVCVLHLIFYHSFYALSRSLSYSISISLVSLIFGLLFIILCCGCLLRLDAQLAPSAQTQFLAASYLRSSASSTYLRPFRWISTFGKQTNRSGTSLVCVYLALPPTELGLADTDTYFSGICIYVLITHTRSHYGRATLGLPRGVSFTDTGFPLGANLSRFQGK